MRFLDLLKLVQGGEIQELAVGKGSKGLAEGFSQFPGSAHRPGLDQGQSFEGLPPASIVVAVVGQRGCNVSGAAFGPQPQIHPIEGPFNGRLRQGLGDHASQLGEEVAIRNGLGRTATERSMGAGLRGDSLAFFPVVAIDQVDIGAVVELLAAQLAHSQHGEAGLPHAAPAVGRLGDPVPAHQAGPAKSRTRGR